MNFNLQALRAIAAYGVVVHHIIDSFDHYIGNGRAPLNIHVGATGVEIFFVISGYIMAATTDTSGVPPMIFLRNRIIRIVPSYWLLTFVATLAVVCGFQILGLHSVDFDYVIRSLLFIPNFNGSGQYEEPVIFVGWSLDYEMMFYIFFFASLFIKDLRTRKICITGILVALVFAGNFSGNVYVEYLGKDIVLAFLLGIVIRAFEERLECSSSVAIPLVVLSLLGLACVDIFPEFVKRPHGDMLIIISAALLVFSVLQLERHGRSTGDGFLRGQGDASYAVYLVHPFVIQVMGKVSILARLNISAVGLAVTMISMFVMSGIAGTLFHLRVEAPLIARLKSYRLGRSLFSRTSPKGAR